MHNPVLGVGAAIPRVLGPRREYGYAGSAFRTHRLSDRRLSIDRGNSRLIVIPRRGLRDAAQAVGQVSATGTPILTGALAAHAASVAAATSSPAMILGMHAAVAIPIIGAAIVGVTIAIIAILKSGCGQTCVITSQWANQAEPLLQDNVKAYFSLPAPRTESQRNAALNNYAVVWAKLQELCSQAGTGDAGVRCIQDRQAGACRWKQRADSPLLQYPGEPQPGECWNWDSGYRAPIANDPVVPDNTVTSAVESVVSSIFGNGSGLPNSGSGFSLSSLLVPALLVGAVVALS